MAETTSLSPAYTAEAVAATSNGRGEPGWLVEKRQEAARAFAALPMPTTKLRPWKYTDVSDLSIESYAPDAAFAEAVTGEAPEGGYAGSLEAAAADSRLGALVEQHLGALVPATEGKFIAANAALWSGGTFVYAPRGRAYSAPVNVRLKAGSGAVYPRLLIVAEAASEVTVLVRGTSSAEALLSSGVVEIVAGADSNVRVVFDLDWGVETRDVTMLRTKTERGATVQVSTLALGGLLVKQTLEGMLAGEGSSAQFRGVALGDGEQHFDFVTLQDHIGPKTTSDVEIKTALGGASRAIYYGVTRVEESAGGAAAEQENRNLLLSSQAKADSDPVLEILTNDVIRCGHGATVGPVDPEAMFYLQARGLTYLEARDLLLHAFAGEVLQGVADEPLRTAIETALFERLERDLARHDAVEGRR